MDIRQRLTWHWYNSDLLSAITNCVAGVLILCCYNGYEKCANGPTRLSSILGAIYCAGFGSQAQTHALLKQLLLLLRLGSKRDAVRAPLLDALLFYLQACRGPRIAHASADLFQAALSGGSFSTAA